MIAAREPRVELGEQRLLAIDTSAGKLRDRRIDALPSLVRPGDVWVLNDAATLPASLSVRASGRELELRLLSERPDGTWWAVLFGEGSWRDDTDGRPAPPELGVGETIRLGGDLFCEVTGVDARTPRWLTLRFHPGGDAFWRALYALGRPVQYSYLARELRLSEVQTSYAGRPWSAELPSAGRPLSPGLIRAMREAGAEVVSLTHAAGLSATGDPTLDALFPLPERYELPERTVAAVEAALASDRRVVAVGTSTTRALEGNVVTHGSLTPGLHETDLTLGPHTTLRVVDALLTGAHDPASSHYQLLRAFAPGPLLAEAVRVSEDLGYLGHELGDSWLIV